MLELSAYPDVCILSKITASFILSAYPDVCILSKITASFILVCCTFPFLVNNYSMCTLFSGV